MSSQPGPRSSHRLPTVSASQALLELRASGPEAISTGLKQLDQLLSPNSGWEDGRDGGLRRGQVAEVCGPPGAGKTTFGLQAAANALKHGNHVVWIDAAAPLVWNRLRDILRAALDHQGDEAPAATEDSVESALRRVHHITAPTLAHLLAITLHPPLNFPPKGTSLVVIDSLSTLFDGAAARELPVNAGVAKSEVVKWAESRRFAVRGELAAALGRAAAAHGAAVLVTCQMVTRLRQGASAVLLPALSGYEWNAAASTRLALFRDWPLRSGKGAEGPEASRFVGVSKANGLVTGEEGGFGSVVPFSITQDGLSDFTLSHRGSGVTVQPVASPIKQLKRRYGEIADSEEEEEEEEADSDELYGWADDDEMASDELDADGATLLRAPTQGQVTLRGDGAAPVSEAVHAT